MKHLDEVLQQVPVILGLLSPTERGLIWRVSKGCREAVDSCVESSGLERAGTLALPFHIAGFASSFEMMAWARTNLCPWDHKLADWVIKHETLEVVKWTSKLSSFPPEFAEQPSDDDAEKKFWEENDAVIIACMAGKLDVVRWLVQHGLAWWGFEASRWAAGGGNVALLDWLRDGGCPFNADAWLFAASTGQVHSMRWLRDKGIRCDGKEASICATAAKFNQLSTLRWLHEEAGFHWDEGCVHEAAYHGHIELLRWALDNGCPAEGLCSNAAAGGQLDVLKFAKDREHPWEDDGKCTAGQAARNGHGEVLRWLLDHGAPKYGLVCALAANGGQLEILQWLVDEYDCPWDGDVCAGAAAGGHVHILRWAQERGVGINEASEHLCAVAAKYGHLSCLQWLREYGCPWDEKVCENAASRGHDEVLRWARENGAPE